MPRCPACFALLTRVEERDIKLCTCPNCFGHWIQKIALLRLTRLLANEAANRTPEQILADQQEIVDLAATVVESNSIKPMHCTVCNAQMVKDRLHPMIPITMDRCPKCDGIWLDVGEFSLLKKLSVELQNTTDPDIIARREKLATALMQWESRTQAAVASHEDANALAEGLNILAWVLRQ